MDKPGIVKKIGNFIQASAKHVANGLARAPENIIQERMTICKSCEQFDSTNIICNVCGCPLEIKTTWASEACPLKKWFAYSSKKVGTFGNIPNPLPMNSNSITFNPCNCGKASL